MLHNHHHYQVLFIQRLSIRRPTVPAPFLAACKLQLFNGLRRFQLHLILKQQQTHKTQVFFQLRPWQFGNLLLSHRWQGFVANADGIEIGFRVAPRFFTAFHGAWYVNRQTSTPWEKPGVFWRKLHHHGVIVWWQG